MPQFLQNVLGYTAENAGLVLSGGGAVVLALMPIVGVLAGKYPVKYIIAAGRLALAIGMYVSMVQLDTLISFQSATVLRLVQSVGLGLLFVPVTMAGYIGMPAEKANSVAGIINFMRNIGSSVGTSMVTTLLARRAQVHQVVLSQHTTRFDISLQNHVRALSAQLVHSGASVSDAPKRAYGLLYRAVGGQVETLAYIDIFQVLTIAASIMFLLSFIVRRNDPKAGGGVAVG
jgi:DHA2 family multidrug resistance protein